MRKVILLVDDDEDDREFFLEAVSQLDENYHCITADNCEDALQQLQAGLVPGIIILDLNMPRMDGRKCLAEIRQLKTLEGTPVIIYTTSSYQKDREDLMRLGADKFITKPSSFRELCSTLEDVLKVPFNHSRFYNSTFAGKDCFIWQ